MVESKQPEEETKEELPQAAIRACATPDCANIATMQCPTCIKLTLEPTYFCGQQCFAAFWKFHKLAHTKPDTKKDDGFYKGSMRPYPYSFAGKRAVPDSVKKPDYAKSGQPNAHF